MIDSLPAFIAHRGGTYLPENTLASFQEAEKVGAKAIEIDVRATKDDKLVVIHDENLVRTVGVPYLIEDLTYEHFTKQCVYFDGEHHPLIGLDTFFEFLQTSSMIANVEIKPHSGKEEIICKECLRLIRQYDVAHKIVVSSYSQTMLKVICELDSSLVLSVVAAKVNDEYLAFARSVGAISIHLDNTYISKDAIDLVKRTGFLCYIFTINDKARAHELFEYGVDGIFTDYILTINDKNRLLEDGN